MKERRLFPNKGLCGYNIEPYIKIVKNVEKIKSLCALNGQHCIYWGTLDRERDYHQCPVYLDRERQWKKHYEKSKCR
jgi:hypothetical protein